MLKESLKAIIILVEIRDMSMSFMFQYLIMNK